jgi:hypothetical protein
VTGQALETSSALTSQHIMGTLLGMETLGIK